MDLLIAFVFFIGAMILCIASGCTMMIALFAGLAAFALVSMRRGFSLRSLCKMAVAGLKDAVIVIEVMLIIGFITAVWRASGTISYFVYYGIKLITPNLFLIITFLLCCLLSYALGTSFGVAGTAGVIFMTLARTGGVSPIITAAVIMSGIYFGDRGSPVSSSAILVASITGTDLLGNVKRMAGTGLAPFLLTLAVYSIFSFTNPIHTVDQSFLHTLSKEFVISPWCVVPAICMLLLPLLKVQVVYAMLISIFSGGAVSLLVQHMEPVRLLKCMVWGFESSGASGAVMNGGGMVSMLEIVGIVALSSTYSGIFAGAGLLTGLQEKLLKLIEKTGRFAVMTIVSISFLGVFCNQTIASMMCCDVLKTPYEKSGASKEELALDLENSVIILAGAVPWTIACTVPLGFLQVGYGAVPLSLFLFLVPLCYGIQKKVANPFTKE